MNMKYIKTFILVLLSLKSFSQDSQLFTNTWNLQKIVIDNVEYTSPFSNVTAEVIFTEDFIFVLHNYCENGLVTEIQYNGGEGFTNANGGVALIATCFELPVLEFYSRHFSIYLEDDNSTAKNPFLYSLSTSSDLTTLVITNGEGNQGYYGNIKLANEIFEERKFIIHPNPVKDFLLFTNLEENETSDIKIYDLHGNLVCSNQAINWSSNSIDVSHLSNGLYLIQIQLKERVRLLFITSLGGYGKKAFHKPPQALARKR
eukprot:gene16303-34108_t